MGGGGGGTPESNTMDTLSPGLGIQQGLKPRALLLSGQCRAPGSWAGV